MDEGPALVFEAHPKRVDVQDAGFQVGLIKHLWAVRQFAGHRAQNLVKGQTTQVCGVFNDDVGHGYCLVAKDLSLHQPGSRESP